MPLDLPQHQKYNRTAMINRASTKRKKLTRKEQRNLDIEIGFMEGVVQRDPKYTEAWKVLSDDYSRRGKENAGLRAIEQLAKLRPNDPDALYNLACCYAVHGRTRESLDALRQAIQNGFNDWKWLSKDPDLRRLRKDPSFKTIWAMISSSVIIG